MECILSALLRVWLQATGTLTESSSKQLLQQWQHVKADALGDSILLHAAVQVQVVVFYRQRNVSQFFCNVLQVPGMQYTNSYLC